MSNDNVVDLSSVTIEDLESLRNRNSQKFQAIQQQGAAIDPFDVEKMRLELFFDLFLNTEQRIQFEYAFETKMTEALDDVLKQIRMSKLTQGVAAGASKLEIPGRG